MNELKAFGYDKFSVPEIKAMLENGSISIGVHNVRQALLEMEGKLESTFAENLWRAQTSNPSLAIVKFFYRYFRHDFKLAEP